MQIFKTYFEQKQQTNSKNTEFNSYYAYQNIKKDLEPKNFYERYKHFAVLAFILVIFTQIASFVSSYSFVFDFVHYKFNLELSTVITIVLLLVLEFSKFFVYNSFLSQAFAVIRHVEPVLLFVALILSIISFFASVYGGAKLGTNTEIELSTNTSYSDSLQNTELTIKKEIADLNTQIAQIQNSDNYKNQVWKNGVLEFKGLSEKGKEQIARLQTEKEKLNLRLDKKERLILAEKEKALSKVENQNLQNSNMFMWVFGSFDILFILLQFFRYHFKRQSLISLEMSNTEERQSIDQKQTVYTPTTKIYTQPKTLQIGFRPQLQKSRPQKDQSIDKTTEIYTKSIPEKSLLDNLPESSEEVYTQSIQSKKTNPKSLDFSKLSIDLTEEEKTKFESLYNKIDNAKSKSILEKYPYTALAISENKSWTDLNKNGEWKECKRALYFQIKRIIKEIDLK